MIDIDAQELGKIKRILGSIHAISKESMLEQSSKAGSKIQKAVRARFLQSTTEWSQQYITYKNGKKRRVLMQGAIAGKGFVMSKSEFGLGRRVSHSKMQNSDSPSNMARFITSFTMQTTGTTIVGGTHKSFTPPKIRNGKIVGTMGRVKGVSKQTLAILEKLNYGTTNTEHSDYFRWHNGKESIENFKGKWKPRHFFEKGFNDVKSTVINDMTSRLEELIGQRANNEIKARDVI